MKKLYIFGLSIIVSTSVFAGSISFTERVRVIKSTPEYRTVTKRIPYQECWDEQVPVNQNSDGTVGALIGGVAGGILGNQIGGGSGKTAATVGGAIIGTLVGKNLAENSNSAPTYKTQRKCVTKYEERTSDKFVGYRNIARYKGRTITKYSNEPLNYINVNVRVTY